MQVYIFFQTIVDLQFDGKITKDLRWRILRHVSIYKKIRRWIKKDPELRSFIIIIIIIVVTAAAVAFSPLSYSQLIAILKLHNIK